jgi:hypothetical protein
MLIQSQSYHDNVIGFELDPKLLAGLTFNIMAQTGESTSDSKQGETAVHDISNI